MTATGEIERRQLDAHDVLVVSIDSEITADGSWWSATVVWAPETSEVGADPGARGAAV